MLPTGEQPAKVEPPPPALNGPVTPASLTQYVESLARSLAARPYASPADPGAQALAALDYEAYRAIRFRPEAALWKDETPFEIQLMHPGFLFDTPVRVHLVEDGEARTLPFDPALFRYDEPAAGLEEALPPSLGYSGFRVHYPLNQPDVQDEVLVFQGASYFRMLGAGHRYGLSSRGLAIDIGGQEEFPDFTEFWLVRPEPGDSTFVFHALLDSPSVTGAYTFELGPGERTTLSVDARLFARVDVPRLGVAPMSSMFLYGANGAGAFDDFRPEVHDSDGVLMHTHRDEWIWRPLSNRRTPVVTSLFDIDPEGFGLLQRARGFERYLDLEARYDLRPGAWARMVGDWGPGSVQLLEMPTESEFRDNIAASWVPEAAFPAGEERHYRYVLSAVDGMSPPGAYRVERTRIGHDALPGEQAPRPRSHRRFVVDFVRPGSEGGTRADAVEPVLESSSGTIADLRTEPLPDAAGWRVSFRLEPDGSQPADMRLYLSTGDSSVSETWSYVWYPDELAGEE